MSPGNGTYEGEFILLGFYEYSEVRYLLFLLFLVAYLLCLIGNTMLIVIILIDSHLHTPMYQLLCNLSFVDICLTSLIFPRFLLTFLNLRSITFSQCLLQVYLFIFFVSAEYLLVTVMSYDRYVAICHPLHYHLILNKRACALLLAMTWGFTMLDPMAVTILLSRQPFCKSHVINHIFCDVVPLLQTSCGDTVTVRIVILSEGAFISLPAFALTVSSYMSIISVILKVQTVGGRRKAFSTCSSHLMVITLLYLSLICVYFQPPSEDFHGSTKAISLLNVMVIPLLNPVLYSLRNKDVKMALHKLLIMKRGPIISHVIDAGLTASN